MDPMRAHKMNSLIMDYFFQDKCNPIKWLSIFDRPDFGMNNVLDELHKMNGLDRQDGPGLQDE